MPMSPGEIPARLDSIGRRAVDELAEFFSRPAFFLSASLVFLVLAVLPGPTFRGFPVLCPFRLATGLPCPGCGAVHCIAALAAGHPVEAFLSHPFVTILALPAALSLPARLVSDRVKGRAPGAAHGLWLSSPRGTGLAFLVFGLAWAVWWIVRVAV